MPEILPLKILTTSTEDNTTTETALVIAFPLNNLAALFIAVAPYIFVPFLNAFTSVADTSDPICLTIFSEISTKALFNPAFDNCSANTALIKVVPPTFNPVYAAFLIAISKSSPFHTDVAKDKTALRPNAPVAIITPFTASKVIDSTVPAFAIFLACSYVKCPFLTIFFASFGSVTPGTSPFSILFSLLELLHHIYLKVPQLA